MPQDELARRLRALADPVRLRILALLPTTDDCESVYNVSELAQEIGLAQPTLSHHLTVLRNAGIVRSRKMCRDVYYWIDHSAIDQLIDNLNQLLKR